MMHDEAVLSIVFSYDTDHFATGSADGKIKVEIKVEAKYRFGTCLLEKPSGNLIQLILKECLPSTLTRYRF